ncbi:hypothetical protein HOK51_01035, partial [Candidatus Woesearchaeota archaeon]|nr:hypothetical protein [Candidatus Woesearchaeota archaeon]
MEEQYTSNKLVVLDSKSYEESGAYSVGKIATSISKYGAFLGAVFHLTATEQSVEKVFLFS